jgi:hypothetical protein
MLSNICNEIKKGVLCRETKIQTLLVKQIPVTQLSVTSAIAYTEQIKPIQEPKKIKNKLITCYEEDYTRNANEVMKYWQRN